MCCVSFKIEGPRNQRLVAINVLSVYFVFPFSFSITFGNNRRPTQIIRLIAYNIPYFFFSGLLLILTMSFGLFKSKSKDGLQAEMEAVSRVLRRWRRTITSNTALAHSSRMRKASSSMSAETGGGGNFVANGPHPINKSKAGGKKQKNESQRQRINRHNNAVGMKVFLSY